MAAENAARVRARKPKPRSARTGIAVMAVVFVVSVVLMISITRPVRRLTAVTRQLAAGNRAARAPRGGSAEIDALAESFNAMADQVVAAETELRAHQAELEKHVAERTRQLHHLAHHDPLTQLPNRRQLSARLGWRTHTRDGHGPEARAAVRRPRQLQVDQRHAGPQLRRPRAAARGGTAAYCGRARARVLARLGGDEFTVLIEDVKSHEEVPERANEIVAALQQPLSIKGRVLSTSASVGAQPVSRSTPRMRMRCCARRTSRSSARRSWAAIAARSIALRCTTRPPSASGSSSRCGARWKRAI